MDDRQFERVAKALADPRRFEILERIAAEGELACKALVEQLPVTQATVSHHLKELANAGLVEVRREAQFGFYRYCPDTLAAYVGEVQRRVPTRVPA